MKNYRQIKKSLLVSKSLGYRILSFLIQTIILGVCSLFAISFIKLSILLTIQKTIIYWIFDYWFVNKYRLSSDTGFVLWATGASGVGKSTLLDAVADKLDKCDRRIERLDGDIVRQSLCADLLFSKKDRETNIKRVTFVSKMLSKNGIGVLASFISPYREIRQYVRENTTNFIELHLIASKDELINRDPKGLYAQAIAGKIKNLTGFDGEYQVPYKAEITINTEHESLESSVEIVIDYLKNNKYI